MSKKAGAVSAETKARILRAAGDEFAACGFQKASLRHICTQAGVTTGAVYFFFDGKDDLFRQLIASVTEPFCAFIRSHYASEKHFQEKKPGEGAAEDYRVAAALIGFRFQDRQGWDILLGSREHPAVQEFLAGVIRESAEHYEAVVSMARQAAGAAQPADRFAVYQFAHMQASTFLSLLEQDFTQEEMLAHVRQITRMLRGAFGALLEE